MRNIAAVLPLLVVMLLMGASCIHAAEPPKQARKEAKKTIDLRALPGTSVTVLAQDCGYFPVIARLGGERVIVVYRAGGGHMGIGGRLEAVTSSDGGQTWRKPTIVADGPKDDRNPAVGVTRSGDIVVAYHVNGNYAGPKEYVPQKGDFATALTRSSDGGRTWTEPYPLNLPSFNGMSPYGQTFHMTDGSLAMPIYGMPKRDEDKIPGATKDASYLIRSRDGGKTWGEPIAIAPEMNETAFTYTRDGTLVAVMRSAENGALYVTRSPNEGKSWSEHEHLVQIRPACITRLSTHQLLVVYGYRKHPFGVRGLIGDPSGTNWRHDRELVFDDTLGNGDCGYPSTVRLDNGRMLTVYYSTRGTSGDAWNDEGARCVLVRYRESEILDQLGDF